MGATDRAARRWVARLPSVPLGDAVAAVHDLRLWEEPSFRYLNGVDALFAALAKGAAADAGVAAAAHAVVGGMLDAFPEYLSHSTVVLDAVLEMFMRCVRCPLSADYEQEVLFPLMGLFVARLKLGLLVHARRVSCDEAFTAIEIAVNALVSPTAAPRAAAAGETRTCPITLEPVVDPVVASDGYTYERAALTTHFLTHGTTSPLTRERLDVRFAGE